MSSIFFLEEAPGDIWNSEFYRNGDILCKVASLGYLNAVKYFIDEAPEGKRIPADIQEGKVLIGAVSSFGDINIVKYLIEKAGVPADIQEGKVLVLFGAVEIIRLDIVEYLVENFYFSIGQLEEAIRIANSANNIGISEWITQSISIIDMNTLK